MLWNPPQDMPMTETESRLAEFASWVKKLKGDEKGEAQVFCERLFKAFGWPGVHAAGATLEHRVFVRGPGGKSTTKFADLVWSGKLLIEMKKRGAKLEQHYQQAFNYWQYIVPHRPRYVILCNFDDIWIYDFDLQVLDPMDRVSIAELPQRYPALNFLFPKPQKPIFGNNRTDVTQSAARQVAELYKVLTNRGIGRESARRYVLQCVVAMFSEDIALLPRGFFTGLVKESLEGGSSHDLIGGLFSAMDRAVPAKGGRYKDIRYFNGGLFEVVEPIELKPEELALLDGAASDHNWSKVNPAIFGTIFQNSMEEEARHAQGAHFTGEAEIDRVVGPTIIRPWRERVAAAKTREALVALRKELEAFQVLDPACGSGNFLYVAYRDLVVVEMELVQRLRTEFRSAQAGKKKVSAASFLSIKQFHGMDNDPFAVDLAKVTMMLAKKLAYDQVTEALNFEQLGLTLEDPLPLPNLDDNIRRGDALFDKWPKVDAIVGNPPYLPKNKMQKELGRSYVHTLREAYPDVSGKADYCVYWFRRAHDELPKNGRAGLVGTNTIRQNTSREGGLGYIVANGGTITEAVSTQVWPGEAVVHVSIVNWIKGKEPGDKVLLWQKGDAKNGEWDRAELPEINASLSPRTDVSEAKPLESNKSSGACFQGQTHGNEGFLITSMEKVADLFHAHPEYRDVLVPYLIGNDLLGRPDGSPSRYAIDFAPREILEAQVFKELFAKVKAEVLPERKVAFDEEERENAKLLKTNPKARVNHHHRNFYNRWWQFSYPRGELMEKLDGLKRYAACVRTTRRPVFEFIAADIHPNDALQVFPLEDDYSFGILQSDIHWQWFTERCSTLKRDYRYTSDTVFDSFAWPQQPSAKDVKLVAEAAVELRTTRRDAMKANGLTLRDLYAALEMPGKSPVKDAHAELDAAVRAAYEMKPKANPLVFLLDLNLELAQAEEDGEGVQGPGLPSVVKKPSGFVTTDCVKPQRLPRR